MPKKLFVNNVCDEFCSLLLSKPLVILDIPQLKKLIDTCRSSTAGCCSLGSAKKIAAEKIAYSILTSLEQEDRKELKEALIDSKKYIGLNIRFPETKKELIL
jgi:hypothetical protein